MFRNAVKKVSDDYIMKENASILNWKRIVVFLVVIGLLLLLLYLTLLYRYIETTRTANFPENKSVMQEAAHLVTIDQMYHFQGEEGYYITYGQNDLAEEWLVFNPENNQDPEKVLAFAAKDLATQKEVEEQWLQSCHGCKLKKSGPAMMNRLPLWEITYVDENSRYVIEYISLQDRSIYEKLKLHLKYNMKG